ncbi:glycosyltransferase [Curtobacterium sp. MCPF17_046]|uniref:glycosyltransferase n=1 Tax=Curtobacterium sp. MCPF17_046 TaxID=2175663 RepID=UPI000D9B48D9|nr:glycosyltransferase [Curtobacterium sp. MCPF17_046]PYY38973.1 glycosyl transferase family 1 [Curtobacterium sp. MCPF17_046]
MRVLHVVSLISSDGAFGGPTRVCQNQSQALQADGHQVTVVAGAAGGDVSPPAIVDGVRTLLFRTRRVPGMGFAGMFAPGMVRWLLDHRTDFDVAHVHLARDLVTLPAVMTLLRSGIPVVVQPHGMIIPSRKLLALPVDGWGTRPALRRASAVLALNERECDDLKHVARDLPQPVVLPNGVPEQEVLDRPPVTDSTEVLYLARLHARKRPLYFVEAAKRLQDRFPSTRFALVGPDEGEAPAVQRAIGNRTSTVAWEGPINPARTMDRMAQCDIYVLSAVDEPFGMTVLEAMSLGKPVVVTESCGLAAAVRRHEAGIVSRDDPDGLAQAIAELLADPAKRARMGEHGRKAVRTEFGMPAVAARLGDVYREAVQQVR